MDQNTRKQYDLHSHSRASDGELTPTELVQHAVNHGVDVLALTDHDVTDGLEEAANEARNKGIQLINGVEISVRWNNKHLIHIVGLNFDPANAELQQGLSGLRQQREIRGEKIAECLAKASINGALEGAKQFANGQILSRTHFARFLLENNFVKSLQGAFDKYLGEGKSAYVSAEWAELEEALGWIKQARGQTVIAHPSRYKLSATKLRALMVDFKALGGDAIEVISGKQDKHSILNMADYAKRYELLASVGSDYHGPSQSWLKMGSIGPLPKQCEPIWSLWEQT